MQTGFRISTRVRGRRSFAGRSDSRQASSALRLPTDSKSLSSAAKLYVRSQSHPMPPVFAIGRESAFTVVPTKFKVLHPEAARRKF